MIGKFYIPPSCPGIAVRRTASLPLAYARASTSFFRRRQDVDGRDKPGHDERVVRAETGLFQ
jgi:hypothetical protein